MQNQLINYCLSVSLLALISTISWRTCHSHWINDWSDDQIGTSQIHYKNFADCSGVSRANGAAQGADNEQIAERADHRCQANDANVRHCQEGWAVE